MPTRPPIHRSKRQQAQKRLYEQGRKDDVAKRLRSTARWQKVRLLKLAQDPLCERCKERGYTKAAQQVHHTVKVRHAPHKAFDLENLVSCCPRCHSILERQDPSMCRAEWAERLGITLSALGPERKARCHAIEEHRG